jgi:3-oxoacyl-[acyl-carrier protein] reductase
MGTRGVIVTGGSRGIGRATVRRFAAAGDAVVFTYGTNDALAADLAAELRAEGAVVEPLQANLRDAATPDAVLEAAARCLPSLDVLVNNAGIYPSAPFVDTDADTIAEVFDVNVVGPLRLMQSFVRAGVGTDRSIVNVTSINAFSPDANLAVYDASKAALAQLTRTAALELGEDGVRVNAVAPGLVDAPGIEDAVPERVRAFVGHAPLRRLVTPEEIADAVFFLASEAASAITGQTLVVDAGVTLAGYMAEVAGP